MIIFNSHSLCHIAHIKCLYTLLSMSNYISKHLDYLYSIQVNSLQKIISKTLLDLLNFHTLQDNKNYLDTICIINYKYLQNKKTQGILSNFDLRN